MEKNRIIEHIINEWAMRSPDGLASGHDTLENQKILSEILNEYGITELDIGDFGVGLGDKKPASVEKEKPQSSRRYKPKAEYIKKDKKTGKEYVVGHPNYADGTSVEDILSGKAIKYTTAEKEKLQLDPELRAQRISESIWEDMKAPNGKNVGADYVNQLEKNIKNLRVPATTKQQFYEKYDKCSLKEALSIYNGSPRDFQEFINAMNGVRHQGLGKGELAFVYMLRDVKSGGLADVDLLNVEGYGSVEVKEVGKGKEKVRISSSTLKGFSRSEFKTAIEDLAMEIRKDEEFGKFLLEVLSGKNPDGTYLYPHPRTPTEDEETALKKFVADPKTADMGKNLFRSFVIISAKLQTTTPKDSTPVQSKVSVSIDGKKTDLAIADAESARQEIQKIATNPNQKQPITLTVSPTRGEDDVNYYNLAKGLKFFDKNYNLQTISEEITALVVKKYKGMLIVSGGVATGDESLPGPNSAKVIETKDIKLEFDSMAQNGIVCAVKTDLANISGAL